MNGIPAALSGRELALVLLLVVPLAVLFTVVPPIAQDVAYHAFADERSFLGVPNFANVVSNLAFLLVGALGLRLCLSRRVEGASRSWSMFFFGTLLVAFGSAYYHWSPNSATLAWDRLPITVAFMALFSALVSEHVRPDIERTLLRVSVFVGLLSVVWWRYTDDLRLYAWVQLGPLLALVFLLVAYKSRFGRRRWLVAGLVCYAGARLAEIADAAILAITGTLMSGHTLKHLLAALAAYCVYVMLRERKPSPSV